MGWGLGLVCPLGSSEPAPSPLLPGPRTYLLEVYLECTLTLRLPVCASFAGYLPNGVHAVEAMLATASIGAIWSATSPDFGMNVSRGPGSALGVCDHMRFSTRLFCVGSFPRLLTEGSSGLCVITAISYIVLGIWALCSVQEGGARASLSPVPLGIWT